MTCEEVARTMFQKSPENCTIAEISAVQSHMSKCAGCRAKAAHVFKLADRVIEDRVGVVKAAQVKKDAQEAGRKVLRRAEKDTEYQEEMKRIKERNRRQTEGN